MKWQLIVDCGPHRGQVIAVTRTPFWIGRALGCHVRLASKAVSPQQCALIVRDDRLLIVANRGSNDTFINGRRLERAKELKLGDQFRIGPLAFVVKGEFAKERPARTSSDKDEEIIAQMLLDMEEPSPRNTT